MGGFKVFQYLRRSQRGKLALACSLAAIFLFALGCSSGGTIGTGVKRVEGDVVERSGAPLAEVIVSLVATAEAGVTDENGAFAIETTGTFEDVIELLFEGPAESFTAALVVDDIPLNTAKAVLTVSIDTDVQLAILEQSAFFDSQGTLLSSEKKSNKQEANDGNDSSDDYASNSDSGSSGGGGRPNGDKGDGGNNGGGGSNSPPDGDPNSGGDDDSTAGPDDEGDGESTPQLPEGPTTPGPDDGGSTPDDGGGDVDYGSQDPGGDDGAVGGGDDGALEDDDDSSF